MKVELRNLSKTFEDNRSILTDINWTDDIRSLAVIGPSGGGKSTLLRILGGLITPSAGEVIIDGEPVLYNENFLLNYRRSIGFVFQAKGLFSHMTAIENIVKPLVAVHGQNASDAISTAKKLLDRFGLIDDGRKFPYQLSGGQQQRIAIARAVSTHPKLLLLDEPTSALDPELTGEVLNMVNELQEEGLHTIIVTHEMGFAKKSCKQMMFLSNGCVEEYGESQLLFNNPSTESLKGFLDKILEWNV